MKAKKVSTKHWSIFHMFSFLVIISMLIASGGSTDVSAKGSIQQPQPAPATSQKAAPQCFAENGITSMNAETGTVGFAGSNLTAPLRQSVEGLRFAAPEEVARGYLTECGSYFGVKDQATDLSVKSQRPTDDGRTVIRFQQNYMGVPVFGGELLMQLTAGNDVLMVNGNLLPATKLDLQPTFDPAVAQQNALHMVAERYEVSVDALTATEPQLWIYSPALIENRAGAASLVWKIEVAPVELAPIRQLVMLNAHDGSVVFDINQVDTALSRATYTANNTTTRPGTLRCNEVDLNCDGDTDAALAHDYSADTYNFFQSYHGRDSIDNAGMTLISTVHYSVNYCNAFWDGVQMTYGDGCSIVADDVVAHEMTHGITSYESNLVYAYQPGAINESFSDIWGEFMDLTNGAGNDIEDHRWVMGEDVLVGGASSPIRNMKNPTLFGDPDRFLSPNYYTGSADNGGVHWNSGVGNKAAYLITDGDTFNGYTITGLGITKATKIYYEVQTNILVSSSNYRALRNALNQACTTLTGTNGITAADCNEVNEATLATEMDFSAAPPSNDNFASATLIPTLPYGNAIEVSGATSEVDDPTLTCTGTKGASSVWYSITAPGTGTINLNTIGSNYDTVLAVYTGSSLASLTSVMCNDDIVTGTNIQSSLSVPVAAGQTYYIEAAAFDAGVNLVLNMGFISADTPTVKSPKGTANTDTTPTYQWTKVAGATQYRYQLYKGQNLVYTHTVAPSACVGSTCSHTPTTVLGYYNNYKWRVQAFIGGSWRAYSPKRPFTIIGPFSSPFTINAAGWTALNGNWLVTGGAYRADGVLNNMTSAVHSGTLTNFTYQARMKRTGSCTSCANVIYFRGVPTPLVSGYWDTGFYFAYTNTGQYTLLYAQGGSYYSLVPWTSSPAIMKNNYNTLKVAASGNSIQYYINGVRLIYGTFTGFNPSGNVGLGMYSNVGATEKLYVDSADVLNLAGIPFMGTSDDTGGTFFSADLQSLTPYEGNPFIAP